MKRAVIRTTHENFLKAVPEYSALAFGKYDSNLLVGGAKGYYRGGGWWVISGYAQDGHDTDRALELLGL